MSISAGWEAGGGVLGVDGTTFVILKFISNIIVHTPCQFSFGYLRSNLCRKTADNVAERHIDFINRLNKEVGFKSIFSFVSNSCNVTTGVRASLVEMKIV